MRGEVHDPRAYAVGGVAGHAGLFSTAADLAKFCRMILRPAGASAAGAHPFSRPAVEAMTRPRFYGDGDIRGLGWGHRDRLFEQTAGALFPPGSFGHTGFTGHVALDRPRVRHVRRGFSPTACIRTAIRATS
jgi:CubicO group peptidase (beta-lactamase class C family)